VEMLAVFHVFSTRATYTAGEGKRGTSQRESGRSTLKGGERWEKKDLSRYSDGGGKVVMGWVEPIINKGLASSIILGRGKMLFSEKGPDAVAGNSQDPPN